MMRSARRLPADDQSIALGYVFRPACDRGAHASAPPINEVNSHRIPQRTKRFLCLSYEVNHQIILAILPRDVPNCSQKGNI